MKVLFQKAAKSQGKLVISFLLPKQVYYHKLLMYLSAVLSCILFSCIFTQN